MSKKEYKRIHKLSKKLLPREHQKKIRKVKDIEEKTESLKYLVVSNYKVRQLDLEHKAAGKRATSLALDAKLRLLSQKIKVLEASHQKRDHDAIENLIKEIKEEIQKCSDS